MKKNLWRLAAALVISASGFLGTILWFNSGKGDASRGNRVAMARLSEADNEVQRKPVQRVIWESVSKDDELFAGEAVRTSANADARLFFMKTGTVVHLEPDSLVVLEETEKGLSLDFLQGNLFVQSTGDAHPAAGEGLTLKTGNGEINLQSADLSLSKAQNGHVNLEVHRGEAVLQRGTQRTALNKEKSAELSEQGVRVANDRLQVLHPLAGETVYLNLAAGEKIDLNWKPLPPGYTVSVELGKGRSMLNPQAEVTATGAAGKLNLAPKSGRWFMRVVATSNDSKLPPLTSPVIPFTIEPKSPPSLVEPRDQASLVRGSDEGPTTFRWLSRNKFSSVVLEVATDPKFKNRKVQENLDPKVNSFIAPLDDGTYYWRVTGFLKLKDKSEALSSAPSRFALAAKWEIKAPTLLSPANGSRLSMADVQRTPLAFKWQMPTGVERVKVNIERQSGEGWVAAHAREVLTPSLRFDQLTSGNYRWTVTSLDPKGSEAKASAPFTFSVEDMPKIQWVENSADGKAPSDPREFEYPTPTPSLAARWKALPVAPATYRFKVTAVDGDEPSTWQLTKQSLFDTSVPADGSYQVVVEALNAKNQVIAQADPRTFKVKRRALLPAPLWSADTPPVLKADGKGNLTFGWEEVPGAQNYLMILQDPKGQILQQREISRNTASVSRLKPGHYSVRLKSIDATKRSGPDGDVRKIEVPATSDIRAPKIRAMKVK